MDDINMQLARYLDEIQSTADHDLYTLKTIAGEIEPPWGSVGIDPHDNAIAFNVTIPVVNLRAPISRSCRAELSIVFTHLYGDSALDDLGLATHFGYLWATRPDSSLAAAHELHQRLAGRVTFMLPEERVVSCKYQSYGTPPYTLSDTTLTLFR